MNIDEIIETWIADSPIDDTDLVRESLNIPKLQSKYLKLYSQARLKRENLKIKKNKLKGTLLEYYKGDLNNPEDLKRIGREPWPRKILKTELDSYIENDSEMEQLNIRLAYQEEIVVVLTEIMKSINNRNFTIKNATDHLKFINGGY